MAKIYFGKQICANEHSWKFQIKYPLFAFIWGKKIDYRLDLSRYTHYAFLISSHFSSDLTIDILRMHLTSFYFQQQSGVHCE